MLIHRTMWPDRRLIDVLQIEHPILLSPMAGFGTVDLAAAVSAAGGLGSIPCAGMEPESAAKTIRALRGLTDKPINVNFFCHVQAKITTDRQEAWRGRLLPYYRELGIDPEGDALASARRTQHLQGAQSRCVRFSTPSVTKIFLTCLFTVFSLLPRIIAISPFDLP